MNFLLLLTFLILPTLAFYWWLTAYSFLNSRTMLLIVSYFFGQFAAAWIVYLLAIGLRFATVLVLRKSLVIFDIVLVLGLLCFIRFHKQQLLDTAQRELSAFSGRSAIIFACCLLFAALLFSPQLHRSGAMVYSSPVYWDFPAQALVLQSFVSGDNFPPHIESFSGVPMPYHYFSFLLIAIYQAAGFHLVDAVNVFSILNFAIMLMGLVGLCEEFFLSTTIGVLSAALAVTSSSLHFVYYLSNQWQKPVSTIIHGILFNQSEPDLVAFGGPAGYNGNMFNLFYFVEERQLLFGVLFLLVWSAILPSARRLSPMLCVLSGATMGLFFKWHFYSLTALLGALGFLVVFAKGSRRPYCIILAAAACVFALQAVIIKAQTTGLLSPSVANVPRFNPEYSTNPPQYPFSVLNMIWYYVYAYGLKLPFFLWGIYIIRKRYRGAFLPLLAFLVPAFIMLNTIQLSPLSIFENHKWLRPMNMFVDVTVAVAISVLFASGGREWRIAGLAALFLLTFSGIIEMMPYFHERPTTFRFSMPGALQTAIQNETSPRALFLGGHTYEVNLAGRRTFSANPREDTGSPMMYNHFINPQLIKERQSMVRAVSNARTRDTFCTLAGSAKVDFVELTGNLARTLGISSHFSANSSSGNPVHYYDVARICGLGRK